MADMKLEVKRPMFTGTQAAMATRRDGVGDDAIPLLSRTSMAFIFSKSSKIARSWTMIIDSFRIGPDYRVPSSHFSQLSSLLGLRAQFSYPGTMPAPFIMASPLARGGKLSMLFDCSRITKFTIHRMILAENPW